MFTTEFGRHQEKCDVKYGTNTEPCETRCLS